MRSSTREVTSSSSELSSISQKQQQMKKPCSCTALIFSSSLWDIKFTQKTKKVIHSIKVGVALLLVSLLYLLDPLFKQVGENAMWAIMTVVVVFEFYAGATLSKGINRGIGTILGGALGCLAAILADEAGKIGNALIVASSVFTFGAAATYCRMVPRIKKRYDYGVMIFILTFNLVAVSGLRADTVMKLARERLSTIGMGFAVCIFTSLLIFPMWASDDLHDSTAAKFHKLASSIQGCLEEYFGAEESEVTDNKENQRVGKIKGCKSVLHSKSTDETLVNFAKWEPWHGKFGISYPWNKYLEIGEILREVAAIVLSLEACIYSSRQPSKMSREIIREACETIGASLVLILRELGESILKMRKCRPKLLISPKLHSLKQELSLLEGLPAVDCNTTKLQQSFSNDDDDEKLAVSSFFFLFTEMVDKVEVLANKVEELEELAGFQPKQLPV